MRSKKIIHSIVIALIFSLTAAGAYAYVVNGNQIAFVEKFETGKVQIDLQELSVDKYGNVTETDEIVEANKDVSYIPRIINQKADCYVRAKVNIDMNGDCNEPLGTEHLYGMSSDWIQKGEYFYYTKILKIRDKTDIFKGIHIPEDWEYGSADGFSINIQAEAIQSSNFMPDFCSDLPWGAVSLQQIRSTDDQKCVEAVPVRCISDIEFDGSGGFQCRSSELFDDFKNVMPGDNLEKIVNIKNTGNDLMKILLKVTPGESQLNQQIGLVISTEDRQLYAGTAAGVSELDIMELLEIGAGDTGTIKLQMNLPYDVDNSYAEMEDDIIWELAVEEISDSSVQTGDSFDMKPYLMAVLFAIILMLTLLMYGRRGRNETNN